jgi:hypothetical protein
VVVVAAGAVVVVVAAGAVVVVVAAGAVVVVVAAGAVVVVVAAGAVVVVVAAGAVVVVVAAGAVVVVLLGGQGFGEQVPAPTLIPFLPAQAVSLSRTQSVKAPIGDDCSQHWIGACVVVVVAAGPVVVVAPGEVVVVLVVASGAVVVVSAGVVVVVVSSGGEVVVVVPPVEHVPSAPHASQQLDWDPTHAIPLCGALQSWSRCLMLHIVWPCSSVRQQVTEFGLPQVDMSAHRTTSSLHSSRSELSLTALIATRSTQCTYLSCLRAPSQSHCSAAASRTAAT